MKAQKIKELLKDIPDDVEVVLWNLDREGSDDAVLEFSIEQGFCNRSQNPNDVRLKRNEKVDCTIPCYVIVCQAGG